MAKIVQRICKNSGLHDPKQVQRFVLDTRRRYEADSYLDAYLTEDEIVDRLIADMVEQIGLTDLRETPRPELTALVKTPKSAGELAALAPFTRNYPIPERGERYYLCQGGACTQPADSISVSVKHSSVLRGPEKSEKIQ